MPFVARIEDIPTASSFKHSGYDSGWNPATVTSIRELAAKSQAWIYFGLLSAILDDDTFNAQHLFQNGAVYTQSLHTILLPDAWRKVETNSCRKTEIQASLRHAWSIFEYVIVPKVASVGNMDVPEDVWDWSSYWIFFSISILLADLTALFAPPELEDARGSFLSTTAGIGEAFRIIGRCPSLPRRMNLRSREAYRLLSWSPSNFKTHDRCTVNSCSLFNVDEQQYKPQHHETCSNLGCCTIGSDYRHLCAIMDNNPVPLVRSTIDEEGKISLSLEAGSLDSEYTAISHVWAGGLGNFQRNHLHECQLVELHKALNTCYREKPLPGPTTRLCG